MQIFKFINKTQIEKKFGGLAENIESNFFPPNFPSDDYFSDLDNINEILVDEEKHREKLKNNKNLTQSPYISYSLSEISNHKDKNMQENNCSSLKNEEICKINSDKINNLNKIPEECKF